MRCSCWDRRITRARARAGGYDVARNERSSSRRRMCCRCTFAFPQQPRHRDAGRSRRMKPTALLVNTAGRSSSRPAPSRGPCAAVGRDTPQ